jgi:hypothetical protein
MIDVSGGKSVKDGRELEATKYCAELVRQSRRARVA